MDLKSILLAIDASDGAGNAARCAARLAASQGAHLIGLHVMDLPHIPRFVSVEIPDEVKALQQERYREAAQRAQTLFEGACEAEGIEGEWRCVEGPTRRTIETHARYADILCTSGPKSDAARGESTLSEELVLSAGKPVLVCPAAHAAEEIGRYVTIAWDGSREAARAVTDAMGVLEHAEKVSVVVVRDGDPPAAVGDLPGADLCHYLARHGVDAQAQAIECEGESVGDALMSWARGQGSDLMVMGAYGHSRFREVLLGGVTRRLLTRASVPLLMSH